MPRSSPALRLLCALGAGAAAVACALAAPPQPAAPPSGVSAPTPAAVPSGASRASASQALASRAEAAETASAASVAPGASLPPAAAIHVVKEVYFGTSLADPYRDLEDLADPAVSAWARAQADHARATLDALPDRPALRARIAQLEATVTARVIDVRRLPDGRIFYQKRGADEDRFKLYVRQGLGGVERLLVDPQVDAGRAPHALDFYAPSRSGRYVAYGVSAGDSRQPVLHVIDVATRRPVAEPLTRTHGSPPQWLPDDSGFFYARQRALAPGAPVTDTYRYQAVYFHRLGDRGPDRAILEAGKSEPLTIAAGDFPLVTPLVDSPYVAAVLRHGVQNEISLYLAARTHVLDPKPTWRPAFGREAEITDFAVHGDDLYLLSHQNALRFKVLKTSLSHPDLAQAQVVVAPGREVLTGLRAARDGLYVQARDVTMGKLYRLAYTPGAQPQPVKLPAAGAVTIASADVRSPGVLVAIGSWTHDQGYYAPDPATGDYVDTALQPPGPASAPAGIEAREVVVKSYDGVEVPLSIVGPRDLARDGSHPTELVGYGAYGVADDPYYLPRQLAWYELGGVRATCHVRGGGVYGEEWHLGGKLDAKHNSWRDLVACADYLVKQGYTTSARLAVDGSGAGGMLVGRAITERPALFAAAVAQAGLLDPMRAETSANGVADIPEFGSVTNEAQLPALFEMDAYHHVRDATPYPAILLVHGLRDPRVPAWNSLKMAARLQAATNSGKPVLLRLDDAGGQGMGDSETQRQEQAADIWSFMLWQFGSLPAR